MSEHEFIEAAFLDNGAVKDELKGLIGHLDYVGYPYKHQSGGTYYANAKGIDWRGLGDTQGHYAYFRYTKNGGGHQRAGEIVQVWLTMAIALPNCGEKAVQAGLLLMDYIEDARVPGAKVLDFSPLRSNRAEVWAEETGLSAEKVRSDISMISFDFKLQYVAPDSCNIANFNCLDCL